MRLSVSSTTPALPQHDDASALPRPDVPSTLPDFSWLDLLADEPAEEPARVPLSLQLPVPRRRGVGEPERGGAQPAPERDEHVVDFYIR